MKSKEELSALKAEIESVNRKLSGLSESELEEVTGGIYSLEEARMAVQKAKAETAVLREKRGGAAYIGEEPVFAVSVENLEAAETILTDADMAEEATQLARQSILAQASQAMIAQANQNAKNVLGLLL